MLVMLHILITAAQHFKHKHGSNDSGGICKQQQHLTPKIPEVERSEETVSPHHHTPFPIKRKTKYHHKKKQF
jgi:hypothetical protein